MDLLFFDTTSTYFEIDEPDPAVPRDAAGRVLDSAPSPAAGPADTDTAGEGAEASRAGFRCRGHSKDHRDDLPQVVIGMAVTRTGFPIRGLDLAGQHHRCHPARPGEKGSAGLAVGPGCSYGCQAAGARSSVGGVSGSRVW